MEAAFSRHVLLISSRYPLILVIYGADAETPMSPHPGRCR